MAQILRVNRQEKRFEMPLGDATATLNYEDEGDGVLDLTSTEVPEELRGQGAGGRLVEQTLDWAREHGYRVIPTCPFVKRYIEEHEDNRELVA